MFCASLPSELPIASARILCDRADSRLRRRLLARRAAWATSQTGQLFPPQRHSLAPARTAAQLARVRSVLLLGQLRQASHLAGMGTSGSGVLAGSGGGCVVP